MLKHRNSKQATAQHDRLRLIMYKIIKHLLYLNKGI